jgi:aspartate dehydrogenase
MGSIIARAISDRGCGAALSGVADLDRHRAGALAEALGVPVLTARELVGNSALVVEAATPDAVGELLEEVARDGRDLLVLSVGGLVECGRALEAAAAAGCRVYCPSGAIAGLDAIRAASIGTIDGAEITTRKPPAGLAGAPGLDFDPASLSEPRVVFEGSAREACRAFPRNVNVSAALSLAGIGFDRTRVRVVADPGVTRNVHEIRVWGDFGQIETRTENVPSENPRTSRLAALSAIALIRRLTASLQVGT